MDVIVAKLISGEIVIGENKGEFIDNVGLLQIIPDMNGSMQIAILPYGFPLEEKFTAKISNKYIIYIYSEYDPKIKQEYLKVKTGLTIVDSMPKDLN